MSDKGQDRSPFDVGFADLPTTLPIFPLTGVLLLPGGRLPLNIFEPRYLAMFSDALSQERIVGMVQPVQPGGFAGDGVSTGSLPPPVRAVGCAGRIASFAETPDGRLLVTLAGLCRFAVGDELPLSAGGYRRVTADFSRFAADMAPSDPQLDRPRLLAALQRFFAARDLSTDWQALGKIDDIALINTVSMVVPLDPADKQTLLEAEDGARRGRLLIGLLEAAMLSEIDPQQQPRH